VSTLVRARAGRSATYVVDKDKPFLVVVEWPIRTHLHESPVALPGIALVRARARRNGRGATVMA
jgi:hypothetical protein